MVNFGIISAFARVLLTLNRHETVPKIESNMDGNAGGFGGGMFFIVIIGVMILFMFMSSRSQKKAQEKRRQRQPQVQQQPQAQTAQDPGSGQRGEVNPRSQDRHKLGNQGESDQGGQEGRQQGGIDAPPPVAPAEGCVQPAAGQGEARPKDGKDAAQF